MHALPCTGVSENHVDPWGFCLCTRSLLYYYSLNIICKLTGKIDLLILGLTHSTTLFWSLSVWNKMALDSAVTIPTLSSSATRNTSKKYKEYAKRLCMLHGYVVEKALCSWNRVCLLCDVCCIWMLTWCTQAKQFILCYSLYGLYTWAMDIMWMRAHVHHS